MQDTATQVAHTITVPSMAVRNMLLNAVELKLDLMARRALKTERPELRDHINERMAELEDVEGQLLAMIFPQESP